MQRAKNLAPGLDKRRFLIGYRTLPTECSDNLLCFSQVISRHTREEVMLNLIAKPPVYEVDNWVAPEISGSEHLEKQEVTLNSLIRNKHAFVVRGKYRSEVKAKHCLMNSNEENPLPDIHEEKHQSRIHYKVRKHENRFNLGIFYIVSLAQELDARKSDANSLK